MPAPSRDDIPRLLRQIRIMVLLSLIALITLTLIVVFPNYRAEIFMAGGLLFLIVLTFWAFTGVASILYRE